jgi:hypothetical protein
MTEKSNTRSTISSTTQTWESLDLLPAAQRAMVEKMMAEANMDINALGQEWGRTVETKDAFVVKIEDGAITVNGRKYDSIDDVPAAERERVQAVRAGFGAGGLMDIFGDKEDGASASFKTAGGASDGATADTQSVSGAASATYARATAGSAGNAAGTSPGYVPPSAGGRRLVQALLVIIVVALLLLAARWQHLL